MPDMPGNIDIGRALYSCKERRTAKSLVHSRPIRSTKVIIPDISGVGRAVRVSYVYCDAAMVRDWVGNTHFLDKVGPGRGKDV